jgi:hypothetical protein
MDDRQRQTINGAARGFTDALVAAYKTTSDGTATAHRLGAQQLEYFFDTVMDNLRAQAEGASEITRQLATQQELARETTRQLTRVSTDNYMDFLDAAFPFYLGGSSRTRRCAEEAQRRVREAEERAEEAEKGKSDAERRTEKAKKDTEQPTGAPRRPKRAKPRAGEAPGRRARPKPRPAPPAARRASGCGPPAGPRSGVGTPDLGGGPAGEGRAKAPSNDARGTERSDSPTARSSTVAGMAEAGNSPPRSRSQNMQVGEKLCDPSCYL